MSPMRGTSARSQIRAVSSADAVAMRVLSGAQAKAYTLLLCPVRVVRCSLVAGFQVWAVPSDEAVAMRVASSRRRR
jgi:hypothetical protein